jgi:Zn-finger nucleic acid-binding protein
MALCPQCDHSILVHTLLTDNLAGYSCGKCLGTLVSLVAYRAWREKQDKGALRATPAAEPDSEPPDSIGAKKCPKCRSLMSKYRIRSDKTNRLDYCPHCEEIWLDEGEWELVEGLAASGEFTKVFTQAWQYAVRAGLTTAMEEQRLRELLGGDYDRVAQFAEWLQSQPSKQEILARLARRPRSEFRSLRRKHPARSRSWRAESRASADRRMAFLSAWCSGCPHHQITTRQRCA